MMNTIICREKSVGPDWSGLNCDLTEYIFKKLPAVSDLIACRKVCRSWCYVSHNRIISNLPIKSPVLLLPKHHLPKHLSKSSSYFFQYCCVETQLYCFFNPVAYELYPLREKSKKLLEGMKFVGSSKGWAIFVTVTEMILFNAPTGTAIRRPIGQPYGAIKKAMLVGDPILDMTRTRKNSRGTVTICNFRNFGLCYAQPGDRNRYIYTGHPEIVYPCDIICFDGFLYAVFEKGSIQAWDFNQISKGASENCKKKVVLEHSYHPSFNRGKELTGNHQLHLVDSSGELWLVSKLGFRTRSHIRVYRMDFNGRKWVDIDSLGDRVVVLCKGQSISFFPMETSKYRRNCVYFEDLGGAASTSGYCIYVYNLDGGYVTKCRHL